MRLKYKFIFLEPFYGGSHKDFADGLIAESRHHIELVTMPARFWKWRMRGAALYFIKKIKSLSDFQGLITTDLMSLSDFKALSESECPPALVYFHENQITYPLAPNEQMDFQFGFTDITTALAAEKILFNSHFHFNDFIKRLPGFINMMPEFHPKWVVDQIREKTNVLYPGCRFSAKQSCLKKHDDPLPLIVWNHRWEFDKNPEDFFNALDKVLAKGYGFRLALLGENFQMVPKPFIAARERYEGRIERYGYVTSRGEYLEWLSRGAIVISTANQENFGISMVEAIRYGCLPLVPDRLSYPEIIPKEYHADFIYKNQEDLIEKLIHLISRYSEFQEKREMLAGKMGSFAWENQIGAYDDLLEKLAQMRENRM